ncbi:MAG TPA: FAD binding domain-containing protein [Gaiellales bacterium]|nr:FAD binding domain-containing protein [Gaiellales bacterium]
MEVHVPRTLEHALRVRAEHPGARPIAGGTDLMVALNAERERPAALIDLGRVPELRGWRYEGDELVLGAALTYTEASGGELAAALPALAAASRTVGSPQIRNRGTIGGNLATGSPAGDSLPPLVVEDARVDLASARGTRSLPIAEFMLGPKRTALEEDELVVAVRVRPSRAPQTFMKIGPRNAMVISVCSLALCADRERGELRAAFGSSSPVVRLVSAPLDEAESFADQVVAAASPIDDLRGTAAYRRHALGVLTRRALARCLV